MRIKVLLAVCMLCGISGFAQSDPTLMTISGHPVSRSEFVYLYNKNNAPGVIQKTSLDDFLRKFIDYKLKVMAAREAQDLCQDTAQDSAIGRMDQTCPDLDQAQSAGYQGSGD